jgi:hypothetical protein
VLVAPRDGLARAHDYQDLLVDEASGQWVVTRQLVAAQFRRGLHAAARWQILYGDASGVTAQALGDPACATRTPACFEVPLAFTADGGVLMQSMAQRGTSIGRYPFGGGGRRAVVRAPLASVIALDAAQRRAVYGAGRSPLRVAPFGARGLDLAHATTLPISAGGAVAIVGDTAYVRVDNTVEAVALHGGAHRVVFGTEALIPPWPLHRAGGEVIFMACPRQANGDMSRACDLVELGAAAGRGPRVIAHGVAFIHDVSADGRFILVAREAPPGRATAWPDLAVVERATGRDVWVVPSVMSTSARFTARVAAGPFQGEGARTAGRDFLHLAAAPSVPSADDQAGGDRRAVRGRGL